MEARVTIAGAAGTRQIPLGELFTGDGDVLFNASAGDLRFHLPRVADPFAWRLVIDTAADAPADAFVTSVGPELGDVSVLPIKSRSLRCYMAHP